jgi:hypothetical protein
LPQIRVIALAIVAFGAALVIILGVIGEYTALVALYNRHADAKTQRTVLTAAGWLLVFVAAGPVYWFLRAFFGTLADDRRAAMNGSLGVIVLAQRIRRALGPRATAMPTWPAWRDRHGRPKGPNRS